MANYRVNPRSFIHTIPMFRYSILFVLGVILCDVLNEECLLGMWLGVREWIIASCVVACGAVVLPKINAMIGDVITLLLIVMIGGLRMSMAEDGVTEIKERSRCEMKLVVASEPIVRGKVIQFDGLISSENEGRWKNYESKKLRCSMLRDTINNKYKDVHIGKGVRGTIGLSALSELTTRNARFDYARWLKTHGFVARGFIGSDEWTIEEVTLGDISCWEYLRLRMLMYREKIVQKIKETGMDESSFAVATAMVLGDKSRLTQELRYEYNASGVSHILALSGMHLSIIYYIFSLLIGRRHRWKRLSVVGVIWAYVLLVGMPVSIMRAATVLTLWEMVSMYWYEQHPLNIFGLALMLIVGLNPYSVWDVGFQLSFAAVLAIVVFMKPIDAITPETCKPLNNRQKRMLGRMTRLKCWALRGLWCIGSISIAAQLGTMPLVLYHFETASGLLGLTNFIVMPLSWIIICGMLLLVVVVVANAAMGGVLWMVACWISGGLSLVIVFQNGILKWISQLPFACLENVHVNDMQVIVVYVVIIWIGIILNGKKDDYNA